MDEKQRTNGDPSKEAASVFFMKKGGFLACGWVLPAEWGKILEKEEKK